MGLGGLSAQPGVSSLIAGVASAEQLLTNVEAGLWEPGAAELVVLGEVAGAA